MAVARQSFWKRFWTLAVIIAVAVSWFFGNLLYSLLWKELADWGVPITEAQMLAYIGAHLTPFLIILVGAGILGVLIRNQLAAISPAKLPSVSPALPIISGQTIQPKLKCRFGMNVPGCVLPNTPYSEGIFVSGVQRVKQTKCTWIRICVDAEGGNVVGAQGRLISLKRAGFELLSGEHPPLGFTHSEATDGSKTVHEGVTEYLDLLAILYDQRIELAVPLHRRSTAVRWGELFSLSGLYEITVMVTAPNATSVPVELILNWNLQPNTARLELKGQQQRTPLAISVGTSIDFYELERRLTNIYSLPKIFKLRVDNTDDQRTISGIKVAITSVSPLDGGYRFPWILSENGSINPGDHTLVPLITFEERRNPEQYADRPYTSDTFGVPAISDRTLLLGIENEHIFHVRCTANDVPPLDTRVKISFVAGRTQIEKI